MYYNVFESIWVYLNVFIVYSNVFECTYSIFIVYFNVSIMYFNVFQCIWKYLSVFKCILNVFRVHLNVFIVYIGVFQCVYNILQCIYSMFQCISMCLNEFINIVIEFHHHILIGMFLPCTPTYTFVFHSIQWLPSQHAIPLHSFFSMPIPTFIQSILTFHIYTSSHILHSMSSLVARSIAEPKFFFLLWSSNGNFGVFFQKHSQGILRVKKTK
jgi:hypothetical protein